VSIKLIAVDMDGTFLDDDMKYNNDRFMKQYHELKARGIKFVVASGNQYDQLKSFFPSIKNEIAFVAENGAYVIDSGKEIFSGEMSKETIKKVIDVIEKYEYTNLIVCGKKSAYIHEDVRVDAYKHARKYYHKLQKVPHFENLNDKIFKFATSFSTKDVSGLLRGLKKSIGSLVTPVSSGHGDIDLIIPGLHKASGIKILQERWGIRNYESAAFGDSGNDLEMISTVQYGIAMENAQKMIKDASRYMTQSNNEEGVLHAIDAILKNEEPFIS